MRLLAAVAAAFSAVTALAQPDWASQKSFLQPGNYDFRNLRVARQYANDTVVILAVDYRYDGFGRPPIRVTPVVEARGKQGSASWFSGEGVTLSAGRGVASFKVYYQDEEPDVPPQITTDKVSLQVTKAGSRQVIGTVSFPQIIAWGGEEAPAATAAVAVASTNAPSASVAAPEAKTVNATETPVAAQLPAPASPPIATNSPATPAPQVSTAPSSPPAPSAPTTPPVTASPTTAPPDAPSPPTASPSVATPSRAATAAKFAAAPSSTTLPPVATGPQTAVAPPVVTVPAVEAAAPAVAAPTLVAAAANPESSSTFAALTPTGRAGWQERFTLGPGDVLNLSLFGEPELALKDVFIGPDGRVSYLEARDVTAAGLTIDELREKLDQELSKYRRAPRTIITPVAFHSKKYYVLGRVAQRGVFTLDRPMTIIEAVARARGLETGLVDRTLTEVADLSRSFLARQGRRVPVDFEKLFQAGDLTQNIPLEPGDYLYFAGGNLRDVYVLGEVNLPGSFGFVPEATAVTAITRRGGFAEKAWKSKVLVVRGSLNRPETFTVDVAAVLAAEAPDFKLQPRDIVYVSNRPWAKAEELLDAAASAFAQAAVITWTGGNIGPFIK